MDKGGARRGPILKGIAKYGGDGWKDPTRKGEVVYVYGSSLPPPYAPSFPRVGCTIWTASPGQFTFTRASFWERLKLLPAIIRDRRQP